MTIIIHPKTGGAALGGSLGLVIVSVLASVHGVHLTPEANAAIPTFLSTLGAFLAPTANDPAPVVVPAPVSPPVVAVAPVEPPPPVA